MVTLLVTLLLGMILASYLILVRSQHVSTARSQAWHTALVLAEAGIEEALAQLNPGITNGPLVVAAGNGWSLSDGFYRPDPPERVLLGGSYAVAYSPENPPLICATGFATIPAGSITLARVVQVTTTNAPLFTAGLRVEKLTNPGRYSYSVNNYNSQDDAYSTGGTYDPTKAKNPGSSSIVARMEFPDVLPPFAPTFGLPTKLGNNYKLSGNCYIPGNLSLRRNDRISVEPNKKATLYISGSFSMGRDVKLEIAATGQLRIFVAGSTTRLGQVDNLGPPQNFQYYGLPGNVNVTLNDPTANFIGVFYCPEATFTFGNDCKINDFMGTLHAKNLTLTRNVRFHFDESLAQSGPRRGFVPNSWRELPH